MIKLFKKPLFFSKKAVTLHPDMKKCIIICSCAMLLMTSCAGEFNKVYKSTDNDYKYEYAKEAFASGKFQQAATLLEELITLKKGTSQSKPVSTSANRSTRVLRSHDSIRHLR